MKKGICALLLLSLAGCMFIVHDGEDIKSIGITKEKAKVEVSDLERIISAEKVKDLPLGQENE
jgi:hypothetical protein